MTPITLSQEYLIKRHEFWKEQISNAGIWNSERFRPVDIVLRPCSRTCGGKFCRLSKNHIGYRAIIDRITVYNNWDNPDEKLIDSVLVHEMIHQYIIQNGYKDTSAHGRLFRDFMNRINTYFPGRLQITVSYKFNGSEFKQQKPSGNKVYLLLMLRTRGHAYCCIVNNKRKAYFETILRKSGRQNGIDGYEWYQSTDHFFFRYRKCTTRLHGIKLVSADVDSFIVAHAMTLIK